MKTNNKRILILALLLSGASLVQASVMDDLMSNSKLRIMLKYLSACGVAVGQTMLPVELRTACSCLAAAVATDAVNDTMAQLHNEPVKAPTAKRNWSKIDDSIRHIMKRGAATWVGLVTQAALQNPLKNLPLNLGAAFSETGFAGQLALWYAGYAVTNEVVDSVIL